MDYTIEQAHADGRHASTHPADRMVWRNAGCPGCLAAYDEHGLPVGGRGDGSMITLEKLPRPDGAPFTCTVDERLPSWPYVRRCGEQAVGMVPDETATALLMGGRLICARHAEEIAEVTR